MSRLVRVLLTCIGFAAVALAMPQAAAAASVEGIKPSGGVYDCGDVSLQLPVGKGTFSAGRVVETGQTFVPQSFTKTLTVDGDEQPMLLQSVTKAAVSAESVTCTATTPQVDEGGFVIGTFTYTVTGTVKSP